jgi:hypothetical protein
MGEAAVRAPDSCHSLVQSSDPVRAGITYADRGDW